MALAYGVYLAMKPILNDCWPPSPSPSPPQSHSGRLIPSDQVRPFVYDRRGRNGRRDVRGSHMIYGGLDCGRWDKSGRKLICGRWLCCMLHVVQLSLNVRCYAAVSCCTTCFPLNNYFLDVSETLSLKRVISRFRSRVVREFPVAK